MLIGYSGKKSTGENRSNFVNLNVWSGLLTLVVCLGLFLAACEDDPTGPDPDNGDPEPDPEVEASFTVTPEVPSVGDEVTLDASATSITNDGEAEYSWVLLPPEESDAVLESESEETTTFIADVAGEYEVELVVTANGASDAVTEVITVTAQEEVSSDITEDRTFQSDVTYIVTDEIDIEATLTIEPGTIVEFENGTGFEIREAGALNAEGTAEDSILFTATDEQPGWWNGIFVRDSENLNNVFDYVTVEYGGGEEYTGSGSGNVVVARTLSGDASISITNSTLRHSGSDGLWLRSNAELPEFINNSFTDNSESPVNIGSHQVHILDTGSSFTGNGNDYIHIRGDYDIEDENITWNNLDVPYHITSGRIEVFDITMTIEPGTTLEFDNGTGLEFRSDAGLIADGSESEPILFTGSDEQPGWWDGIFLRSTTNLNNVLNHVTVEYAGGEEYTGSGSGNVVLARTLGGDASVDITNTTLRYSASDGLWVRDNGDLSEFENNTITNNSDAPVNISSNKVHQLDETSAYTGNGDDYIYVRANHDIEDEDVTWTNLDVDYQLNSDNFDVNDINMTIEPGVTLEFESGGGFELRSGSGFIAEGTGEDPILFTGTEEQPGWWNGIYLRSTTNPVNIIENVTIEYAGGEEYTGTGSGNLVVGRSLSSGDASVDVINSTIRHSESYGIYVHENGTVNDEICDENTFENNAAGDCEIQD